MESWCRLPTEGAPSKMLEKDGSYWVNSMKNPSILFPLCWLHQSAHGPRFWVAISVIRPTKLEHAGEVSEKFWFWKDSLQKIEFFVFFFLKRFTLDPTRRQGGGWIAFRNFAAGFIVDRLDYGSVLRTEDTSQKHCERCVGCDGKLFAREGFQEMRKNRGNCWGGDFSENRC